MDDIDDIINDSVFGKPTKPGNKKERVPDYTLDSALTVREELIVFPELAELQDECPEGELGRTPSSNEYNLHRSKGSCIGTPIISFQALVRGLVSSENYEQIVELNKHWPDKKTSPLTSHSGITYLRDSDCDGLEAGCKQLFTGKPISEEEIKNSCSLLGRLRDCDKSPLLKLLTNVENALSGLVAFSNHLETHPNVAYPTTSANQDGITVGHDTGLQCAMLRMQVGAATLSLDQLATVCLLYSQYRDAIDRQDTRYHPTQRTRSMKRRYTHWSVPHLAEPDVSDILESVRPKEKPAIKLVYKSRLTSIETLIHNISNVILEKGRAIHLLRELEAKCIGSDQKIIIVIKAYRNTVVSELYLDSVLLFRHACSKLFLLCLKDVVAQRRIVLSLASIRSQFQDYLIPPYNTISKLYWIGDVALMLRGNPGYSFVKTFETEAIANLHRKSEERLEFVVKSDFYAAMTQEIDAVAEEMGISLLSKQLHELFGELEEEEILEMAGLFRHWGHPIIFVSLGLSKVHANATKDVNKNLGLMRELAADLKHLLVREYFKKNGVWPPNTTYNGKNKVLSRAIKTGTFPSVSMGDHIGEEWLNVSFSWCVERNAVIPILELIGDKSHSVGRAELMNLLRKRNLLMQSSSRRVLETLLSCSIIDIDQLLNEIDSSGLPPDDLIIQLNEKEREMKLEGRLFALMTFRLRCYFVATEWLISKYILPVLPEISVNKSQTELQKSLYNLTGINLLEKEFNQHFIHLDYEKWNNFQRHESTYEVFKVIDEALGYKRLISRTHEIFSSCFITYSKRLDKIPKDLSENLPWCWWGHKGGLEGLRQKGWSVVGALLLRKVARLVGRKIQVLLQGDNQLVVLRYDCMYSKTEKEYLQERINIRRLSEEVLNNICVLSDSIGLHIKREETWMSNNILYYGKYPVLYGTARGMVLKRLCRLFSMANELTPSLANLLNATVTTCLSAGVQKSCSWELPLICWWYQCRIINRYFIYDPLCGRPGWEVLAHYLYGSKRPVHWDPLRNNLQYRLLLRMLLTEPSMGGIGGTLPLRFMVRSFPDPVSESLTGCNLLLRLPYLSNDIKRVLINIGNPPMGKFTRYISLLEDPTSLNISKTTKPTNVIRDAVLDLLKREKNTLVKNIDLYKALHVLDQDEERFIEVIMQTQPCFVKLISNIYSASIFGVAHSVVAKFVGTRTLVTLALQNSSIQVRAKLADCEDKLYKSLATLFLESGQDTWACSYQQANSLRETGWGLPILGVTIPHPLEQFAEHKARACRGCLDHGSYGDILGGFVLSIPDRYVWDSKGLLNRGVFEPYLGGRTAEKRIGLTALEGDTRMTPVERVGRLLKDSGWVYQKGGNLHHLLLQLLASFTTLDVESLVAAYSITSGDLEHRYSTSRIPTGAFCSNSFTGPSHVNCSSNNMGALGRGRDNYLIVYQALFLLAASRQYHRIQLSGSSFASHWHPDCEGCLVRCSEFTCEISNRWRLMLPCLKALPCPIERSLCIPDSQEFKGRYTFLSESAVRVRLPTWIRLPIIPKEEPVETLQNSMLLIISLTTLNLPIEDNQIPTESSNSLSVSHLLTCPITEVIRCQSSLIVLSCVLAELARETDHTSQQQLYKSLTEAVSCNQEVIISNALTLCDKAGTKLLIRTIGNSDWAVRDLVRQYPGPKVGPYPISHEYLSRMYKGILKESVRKTSVRTHLCKASELFDRIIIPSDYMSPSFVIGIAYVQRVLSNPDDITAVLNWKDNLLEKISMGWDLVEGQQHRGLIKLHRTSAIWKINMDMKSILKQLGAKGGANLRPRIHRLVLPNATAATVLRLRGRNTERPATDCNVRLWRSPLVHFVRPVVYGANGTRKILSILKEIYQPSPNIIVVAGDGNGGFSRVCLTLYPKSRVLFTSLAQYSGSLEQAGNIQIPMCLMDLSDGELVARLISPHSALTEETDITAPGWVGGTLFRLGGLTPDLIISDAELRDRSKIKRLINQMLTLGTSTHCPELLIKLHLRPLSSPDLASDIVQALQMYTDYSARLLRSAYSNYGSLEVYVHFIHYALKGSDTDHDLISSHTSELSLTDEWIVKDNQDSFVISDRAQVALVRSDTLDCTGPTYNSEWVRRGLWEGEALSGGLGVQLPILDKLTAVDGLYKTLQTISMLMSSSVVKTATFRSGLEARRVGRVIPRTVAVHLIGCSLGLGLVISVLCDNLAAYKSIVKWYRLDSIAIRCHCRKDIPFDLGLQGHNVGMDIPFREYRPICHSMIRYLASVVRTFHTGSLLKLNPSVYRKLLDTPVFKSILKTYPDFRNDYSISDEGVISHIGTLDSSHHEYSEI